MWFVLISDIGENGGSAAGRGAAVRPPTLASSPLKYIDKEDSSIGVVADGVGSCGALPCEVEGIWLTSGTLAVLLRPVEGP